MPRIKKIVAPTDFSELSKGGVRYAFEIARDTGAELLVYHAIDFSSEWASQRGESMARHDLLDHWDKNLKTFVAENFAEYVNLVECRSLVEIGSPVHNLIEKAREENADIIVMSTHGRTGLDHIILGSVAEKVVARAPCPVLVVPRSSGHSTKARAA